MRLEADIRVKDRASGKLAGRAGRLWGRASAAAPEPQRRALSAHMGADPLSLSV